MANALFRSSRHLTNGCTTLADPCTKGIGANGRDAVLARGLMTSGQLEEALRQENRTRPRLPTAAQTEV